MASASKIDFRNPPVIEVVLGAQFSGLNLPLAQLARFSDFLPSTFADKGEAAVVQDVFETFEDGPGWRDQELRFSNRPNCRFQFRNSQSGQMVQLQRTRLLFNWMGTGDAYPRFETVFAAFQERLTEFQRFVQDSALEPVRINQWEITYLNDVERGTLWTTAEEWGFTKLFSPPVLSCGRLDSFSGNWHIALKDNRGRIHIDWEHLQKGLGKEGRQEVVRMNLTARGPADDVSSLLDGLKLGHESIVCTFSELATDRADEHWGRN